MLILLAAGDPAVGVRHKLLELFLKGQGRLGLIPRGSRLRIRGALLLLCALDGQADLARLVDADDLNADTLPFRQMGANVTDVCIGNLGNVHHPGAVFREQNKRAEFCD